MHRGRGRGRQFDGFFAVTALSIENKNTLFSECPHDESLPPAGPHLPTSLVFPDPSPPHCHRGPPSFVEKGNHGAEHVRDRLREPRRRFRQGRAGHRRPQQDRPPPPSRLRWGSHLPEGGLPGRQPHHRHTGAFPPRRKDKVKGRTCGSTCARTTFCGWVFPVRCPPMLYCKHARTYALPTKGDVYSSSISSRFSRGLGVCGY